MENLRRVVQVLSFVAFLYLFVLTIGRFDASAKQNVLTSKAPIDTFFRIDPLLGLTTMIATRHIIIVMLIYGLPVVILTMLFGRFFCGWICPLGTTLDATDRVFFWKRRRVSRTSSRNTASISESSSQDTASVSVKEFPEMAEARGELWKTKYYILAGMLVAAVFASQLAYLLDPFTIITRAFTFGAFPIITLLTHSVYDLGYTHLQSPYIPSDVQYFFRLNFLAVAVFVGILAANSFSRRFWCRNLCPLGAMLGLLSRFSILQRAVKPDCIKCKKCISECKMGAVYEDPLEYRAPECIYCYSCTSICPTLSTSIAPTIHSEGYHGEVDLSRRRIFQAAGVGLAVALLGKTNAAAKTSRSGQNKVSSEFLLRPPGALPEDEFVDRCLRCSECMKVCPTNGLQPALTEAGIDGLWTPVLVPRIGECTRQCNLCSQVCSSQAIQPFEVVEKSHIYIGRAVIDRSRCLAWNSDKQCLVCNECCSYRAVLWKTVDGVRRPFIDEHKCVGCGICENVCPVQPVAAIRSFSSGDQRNESREKQKQFFEQKG